MFSFGCCLLIWKSDGLNQCMNDAVDSDKPASEPRFPPVKLLRAVSIQDQPMKNGFFISSVVLFSFANLVSGQPRGSGNAPLTPPPPAAEVPNPVAATGDQTHPPSAPGDNGPCASVLCCREDACAVRPICGPAGRVWASAEYLLWWFEGSRVPPLVTTSPPASNGVLGAPGTTVLFGGSRVDEDAHSGGQFTLGYWLNECQTIGVEGGYFFLGSRSEEFTAGGSGLPGSQVIARPLINAVTGAETAQLVSFPGAAAGTIHIDSSSRLEGANALGVANLCCSCCSRVDLLAGFRYLELREGIGIAENIALSPTIPTIGGSRLAVAESFNTRNQFYGGQLGARAEYRWGRIFINAAGSFALGTNHETIDIRGSTTITPPGGVPTTLAGGILALPTNIGHFSRDRFAVVPEVGINVGYQLTTYLRAYMGYRFLYDSNVVRPGDAIDRTVNVSQIPSVLGPGTLVGPARPAVIFKDTEFWAQGMNFGLEFRY
jgi:hypothetical protein